MTHHEGFLRDIIEHPADDAPRLIYADWLEEHGDPDRAEFVRVQCELARSEMKPCTCFPSRWPGQTYVCQRCTLRRRERELLTASYALDWGPDRALWDAGFDRAIMTYWESGESLPPGYAGTLFRRGFVAEVTLSCKAWLEHGPALVKAAPLQRVALSDCRPAEHGRYVAWYRYPLSGIPEHLPPSLPAALYDLLTGGVPSTPQGSMREYLSPAGARDDLSAACLKYARNPVPAVH
jgi:uncharacterized protein (TIGR02996 family)